MKTAFWALLAAAFLTAGTAGYAAETSSIPSTTETAGKIKDDYLIEVGDVLEILTWKEPEFTREVIVRSDGKITFPLLDDLPAAGLPPMELKKIIETGLKKFVSDPMVTVIVKLPIVPKFYILGEVQKTGEYPLTKGLTALQAFALAGGFTEWASEKRIVVMRRIDGQETIFNVNYKNIVKGKDLSQNILVRPGDTIIVP